MARAVPAFYLDEDVPVAVGAILEARGYSILTARDAQYLGRPDADQLAHATETGRALLTHNRVHFERVHSEWLEAGRSHAGILVATRRHPRELADRVARLSARLSAEERRNQLLYI